MANAYKGFCDRCRYEEFKPDEYPCRECTSIRCKDEAPAEFQPKDEPKPAAKLPGAKDSKGKLVLSDVPPEVIRAIAKIREYGNKKYADPDNWRRLPITVFHEALLRHALAMWEDAYAIDEESGLPALWHLACNAAFLCALMEEDFTDGDGR